MVIIGPIANNTPGLSNAVQLCLICQNVKNGGGSSKLTSTVTGRQKIISTSRKLEYGLATNIDQDRLVDLRCHVTFC